MKTKIIPFDAKMAKDIQDGKIEGKIVRNCNPKQVCEILAFDAKYQDKCGENFLIVKIPAHDFEKEKLWVYHQDGRAHHNAYQKMWYDLVLEVPDEPQFKPFDKVLVRNSVNGGDAIWEPQFYSMSQMYHGELIHKMMDGYEYDQVIPYEGNEHLVGTSDKPKLE